MGKRGAAGGKAEGLRRVPSAPAIARLIGSNSLGAWLERAHQSLLNSFARGMTGDVDPVWAAIALSWANAQTEGQITTLKLVKRQMYGRAKLDLLVARLIAATT